MDEHALIAGAREIADPGERSAWLDAECGSDHALRRRMDELLLDDEPAGASRTIPLSVRREVSAAACDEPTVAPDQDAQLSNDSTDWSQTRIFGEYELLEEIARGGMGVVFRARQHRLNRTVAIKMILAGELASEVEIQRFYAEAESAAQLDHPGIVPIFDVGHREGQHFFSMAFIEGESLADRIVGGPMPPREAAILVKKVCDAIQYAHDQGVIHRDLKPANILIDSNGQPRVTDFGLAKSLEHDHDLTGTGQILGTPGFMPPEQAKAKGGEIGPLADLYSIGAILYCVLTGRPPFQAASPLDTLLQVIERDPVPPAQLNHVIDEDLQTICMKCLSKSPDNRYASVRELGDDLARYLSGQAIHARASTVLSRTWLEMISESRHTEVIAMWDQVWRWNGIVLVVLFFTTSIMQWMQISPWLIAALWVPGTFVIGAIVWYKRIHTRVPLVPIEKQITQVWFTFGVAAILTAIINHMMHLPTLQLLPLVVLQCGIAFSATATILGGSYYLMGFACFVMSMLMVVVPAAAGTAIFGVLFAIGLVAPSIKLALKRKPTG